MKTIKEKPGDHRRISGRVRNAESRGIARRNGVKAAAVIRLALHVGREESWRVPLDYGLPRTTQLPVAAPSIELKRTVTVPRTQPALRLSLIRSVAQSALRRDGASWGR